METLEQRINHFIAEWEYYYFPDRQSKCQPTIDAFIKEVDQLLEKQSIFINYN